MQVSLAPNGGYLIDHVVAGDTVTEVLNYVSYNKDDLVAQAAHASPRRRCAQGTHHAWTSRARCCAMYEEGLSGYTYLEREVDAKFAAASHGQLRLVAPHDRSAPPRLTPPPTGT